MDSMKPGIDSTNFGSITISGVKYENDVVIRLDGGVEKRKKKLSKAIYGTSHMLSLDEAKHVYEPGAKRLIIGAGQIGMVKLSDQAESFFKENRCKVSILPTPKAIEEWNASKGAIIGLFHVTC
jgi:hypothetical protein